MIIEKHIPVTDPDQSVVEIINHNSDFSIGQIKQAIAKGCLWLSFNGNTRRLRRLKTKLQSGQELHFYYNSKVLELEPLDARLIADLEGYSIWNKPAGMLCQGSKWSDHTTIKRYVENYFNNDRIAMVVHRLDKMTSGLIIIAHRKKVAAAFTTIFEKRAIHKYYHAVVAGRFAALEHQTKKGFTINTAIDGKPAVSHLKLLEYNAKTDESLLEVKIETGRKHQIRKHLSSVGFPVIGDRLYGTMLDDEPQPDLKLTAVKIEFHCPLTSKNVAFELKKT